MRRVLYGACLAALLVASPAGAQEKSGATPITVAILLFNQPYITELAGPLDVYHHVPSERLRVFTVSDTERELVTYEGMPFRTNYTIDNAPKIDILVVPSGAGSLDADPRNGRVISWVKEVSRRAKLVTSHCEGAFVLAAAGLLDDKDATTFHTDTDTLQKRYPACRVIKGQRIVVDGNVITSAGGLASYEGALYVVAKLFGREEAQRIATALVFGQSNLQEVDRLE